MRARTRFWLAGLALIALAIGGSPAPTVEAADARPTLGLPFSTPPGPGTWLLGQTYGNTVGGYARRREWYGAGQGIHFGVDFSAKCGTPIVAVADGTVVFADALSHGSAPHNLAIEHPNGYVSFYGHLLERPALRAGQVVKRGDVIAKTGDPDLTCTSRPHLHLEIRDRSLSRAYNPVLLIDADWDALMLAGSFGRGFQRDLDAPRKWQTVFDQPDIQFGGPMINDFVRTYPQDWR